MRISLLIFCGLFFISSCIKRIDGPLDITVSELPKIEIPLLENYPQKVYYNLESKSIVKTSSNLNWDIAFSSNPTSSDHNVILNYSLGVSCNGFTLKDTNYSKVYDESIFSSNTLKYANYYDSFAILFEENFYGANASYQYVYYLNFANSYYVKMQILDYTTSYVKIRYSRLDGSSEQIAMIPLSSNQNYTYFKLFPSEIVDIEPLDKTSWDIEFTTYTTYIYDFGLPRMYRVAGALYNPSKSIKTCYFENARIENIVSSQLTNATYTSSLKGIGYEWKQWSNPGQTGFYTIVPRVYGIQNAGKYYTIQFTEFSKIIDGKAVNGYPTFLQNSL